MAVINKVNSNILSLFYLLRVHCCRLDTTWPLLMAGLAASNIVAMNSLKGGRPVMCDVTTSTLYL